jgi:DNA-binding CsgD family transcriptional regulator
LAVVHAQAWAGTSALLSGLRDDLHQSGHDVEMIRGTASAVSVSLAPFAHLVARTWPTDTVDPPLSLLMGALRAELAERRVVLLVDDAHLFDPASAAVLARLVLDDDVPTAMALRTGARLPSDIAVLAHLAAAERVDLVGLDRDGSDELVEQIVGGPVDEYVLEAAWDLAGGVPSLLHLLFEPCAGLGPSARSDTDLLERLANGVDVPSAIAGVLARRLDELDDDRLALALSICGSLPLAVAEQAFGVAVVDAALQCGVARRETAGTRSTLWIANGLLRGHLRRSATEAGRHEAARAVLDAIDAASDGLPVGTRRSDDAVLRARLQSVLGTPDTDVCTQAAHLLLCRHDPVGALELLDGLRGDRPAATADLTRATAQSMLGRRLEAAETFAALERSGGSARTSEIAYRRALTQLYDEADPTAAEHTITDALAGVPDADAMRLRALLPAVAFHRGDPLEAVERGRDAIRAGPLPFDALPGLLSAHVAVGDPAGVLGLLTGPSQLATWDHTASALSLVPVRLLALLQLGRLGELRTPTEGMPGIETSTLADSWCVRRLLPATLTLLTGSLGRRHRVMDDLSHVVRGTPVSFAAFVLALLSHRAAVRGRCGEARELLDRGAALPGAAAAGLRWWYERAEISIIAAEGHTAEAVQRSVACAGDHAGMHFYVTTSLHDAVRFGDGIAVRDPLRAMARRQGATWWDTVCADHAEALAVADVGGLLEVCDRLEQGGLLHDALTAARQAADLAARPGGSPDDRAWMADALGTLDRLQEVCGTMPAPVTRQALPSLSDREYEVALLAASCLSNRSIAERLGTSVRTVSNQLQRAYEKLGVHSRDDLGQLLMGRPG